MKSPSKILLGLEGVRSIFEYGLSTIFRPHLECVCPPGDGHPVIILPGLGASDRSTIYLRDFLNGIGYNALPWGLGRNFGPREGLDFFLEKLSKNIEGIYDIYGNQPISLIGWSLGGVYSREVAKIYPEKIRQVITLGSPFKGNPSTTNATLLYELLSKDKSHKDKEIIKKINIPPPVPFTSIYSKTDGVVHWTSSVEAPGPLIENIEIPFASHLGLGHNPLAIFFIANRLKYTKDTWKPCNF